MRTWSHSRRGGWMGALAGVSLATTAHATSPDAITMHHAAKASLAVLANDTGTWNTATLAVATPPTYGTATVQGARILYHHTSGMPAGDAFTYTVADTLGVTSTPETVTITFSTDLRLAATTVTVPQTPPSTAYEVVDAFPGITFGAPTSIESPPGDPTRLFVVEKAGRVHVITNLGSATRGAILFLDISERVTNDYSELGMKGITFHPGYTTNGIFYVTYCSTAGTVRLSRFLRSAGNPNAADPLSEVMLIDQPNDGIMHNIDDALFGPDGYLYVGMGDEGSISDTFTNTQVIDKDLWSAILRIDPDKRPGNVEPNPHPGVPTNGAGLAYYSIPADNPFIGATQFNGVAVNPAAVRTEFYAVGFRNPWQFSFDALTGELWVGDVGDTLWEEIDIVPPGGNGGWAFFEASHPGPRSPPPGFTYIAPVWEYPHDVGPFAGSAVVGGLVVRGTNYPDLAGKYVCADVLSGNIWSLERTAFTTIVERIAGEGTIVQFGLDPSNGDILMVDFDEGRLRRLVTSVNTNPYPAALSDTGVFADLADLSPNPGVLAYGVNVPFWSDHAIKRRWFAITNLTDDITYAQDAPWTFPPGMVWIKHFDLELDRGNTNTRKRIETRLLVKTTNGSYGVSYRWNDGGTEASLVADSGDLFTLAITNSGVPGTQTWRIPSRAECVACHRAVAGSALSFESRQLNRTGTWAGVSGNLLDLLESAGYTTNAVDDPQLLPRYVRPDETEYSLEARARTYLAVNCGYCHRGANGSAGGAWDGRPHPTLLQCSIVGVSAGVSGGSTNDLLVVPGSTSNSIIWNRIAVTNGYSRMPPLGSTVLDTNGIQLVAQWITQELPGWRSYAMWRGEKFGNTNSPDGEPSADPDGDQQSNYEEFLTYGDPTNAASRWAAGIRTSTGGVEIVYSLFNRSVVVEHSPDLVQWSPWSVAGNQGLPSASGAVVRISGVETNDRTFYRFRIREP